MDTVLNWLMDVILWLPRHIFAGMVDLFQALWALLPDFGGSAIAQNIQALFTNQDMIYFFILFRLSDGFSLVITSYIARFIVRRLPGLG